MNNQSSLAVKGINDATEARNFLLNRGVESLRAKAGYSPCKKSGTKQKVLTHGYSWRSLGKDERTEMSIETDGTTKQLFCVHLYHNCYLFFDDRMDYINRAVILTRIRNEVELEGKTGKNYGDLLNAP